MQTGGARGARGWRGAAVVLAGVVTAVLALPFFDRWFSYVDEGHILLYADLVAKGGQLYRDATLYPLPGAFYLLALAFEAFGTSILVARWIVLIEFALFAALTFALLLRAFRPSVAFLGLLLLALYRIWAFPHWHMYSYSTTALCLLAGSLLAFAVYLERGRLLPLGVAGLLSGLAAACKQDYGAAALLAMSAAVVLAPPSARGTRRRLTGLVALNAPAAAVGGVVVLYFLRQGLLLEMLRQTVWGHLGGIASFAYPTLPPALPLLAQEPSLRDAVAMFVYAPGLLNTVALDTFRQSALYRETIAWDLALKVFYYGPYFITAATGALLWLRRRRPEPDRRARAAQLALWSYAAVFLLLLTANRPQDYVHFAVLYTPFLALFLLPFDAVLGARPRLGRVLWLLALALACAALLPSARLFWELRAQHTRRLELPRAGIYVRPHEARTLEEVTAYLRERVPPGRPTAAMPYFPIALFLADREGPHRSSYVVWPVADVQGRDRAIIRALDEEGVDTVLWNFTQASGFPPVSEYAPELYAHLVDRFEIERVFTEERWGYLLAGLRRSRESPAGRALLTERSDVSAIWTETPEGERKPTGQIPGSRVLEIGLWPFRRAVGLRPRCDGGRTVLELPIEEVPPGAHLETAVATHPQRWFHYPASWVRFDLEVVDGGRRETVYSRRIDPNRELADRRWFDVRVPLDRFAGHSIVLELATACEWERAKDVRSAGWELPRLVIRSGARGRPAGG